MRRNTRATCHTALPIHHSRPMALSFLCLGNLWLPVCAERERGERDEGSLASCRQPGNFINCVDTCQIGNTYHHTPPCHPCFVFIWYARKGACKQALIFYWACHNIYDMYLMRVPRLSDATQLLSTVNLMQPITCPPLTLSLHHTLSHSLLLRDNAESLRREKSFIIISIKRPTPLSFGFY